MLSSAAHNVGGPRARAPLARGRGLAPLSRAVLPFRVPADLLTTVMEAAYYGKATSSSSAGGIVLVKTRRALVLATFAEPVTAAEAIPHTHRFADNLEALTSPV